MSIPYAKVIANPRAGAGSTRRKWPQLSERLRQAGLAFVHEFTEGTGHAMELAQAAANDGYRYLVAVGGDGTVNEVVNGILRSTGSRDVILGVISIGTGDSFVRSAGIPRNYARACSLLTSPRRRLIDVGVVEYKSGGQTLQRFFVNVGGVGFDAAILDGAKRLPRFFGGYVSYLAGFPGCLFTCKNRSVTMSIGSRVEDERILTVVAANGSYFDGGIRIAPQAELGDGSLDVVIVGDMSKLEVLKIWPPTYKGNHVAHPTVRVKKATHVAIESSEKVLVQADGELPRECPASFRLIPSALTIVA